MTFKQFLRVSRPPTLAATVVPMLVGASVSWVSGPFSWWAWLDMVAIGFAMQIGANMLNEYYDYQDGLDVEGTLGIGGIIVSGEVSPQTVWRVAIICYTIAFVLGMILVITTSPWLLAMGIVGILAGFIYAGGPLPLSSTPFGEVIVFLIMGPLEVTATNLATTGHIAPLAWIASIPVGFLVAAILMANNLRDRRADATHGRRTIPVLVGPQAGFAVLTTLIVLAYGTTLAFIALHRLPASAAIALISIPLALKSLRTMTTETGLQAGVPIVGRLHVINGFLLTVGILWNLKA